MKDKSTPNQMRILLKRMRGESYTPETKVNEPKKNLNMRDVLGITRRLNEEEEPRQSNKKTMYDQPREEEQFLKAVGKNDMDISVDFEELEVYEDRVFWAGTIDGVIQFVFKVTPKEATSGVEFEYLQDFSPDNPDNEVIIERIENYYDTFSKYWRNNLLQQ